MNNENNIIEESRSIKIEELQISEFIPKKMTEDGKFKYSYTIPKFQREFVWDYTDLKDLWDSIYRNYPIGSFMIWECEDELPDNRQIADNICLVRSEGNTFKYILDGQQRITSLIVSIFKGLKKREGKKKPSDLTLYFHLKNAKNEIKERDFENKKKINLFFTKKDINTLPQEEKKYLIEISKLINFGDTIYSNFYDAGEKDIARLYQNIYQRITSKYRLSVITLKNIPKEEVCELFTRVNTKGRKLSAIDLITAYTYRDDFYLKSEEYLGKLSGDLSSLNYDDLDEMLFIRLISMVVKGSCAESDIFELKAYDFKENWSMAADAIKEAIQFLRDLNITSSLIIPYSPMLISLSYFFYLLRKKRETFTDDVKNRIVKWFWVRSLNGDYQGATNEKVKNDCSSFKNFIESKSGFTFNFSRNIDTNKLINEELRLSSGFCKTLLCLMANNNPVDFTNHKPVDIYDVLVEYKKSEYHHIFPRKSDVGKKYPEEKINSIVNICFLPKASNKHVDNDNPSLYFEKKVKQKMSSILKT